MKQKLLKLMCLLCVGMMGMSAWAETKTITLTYSSFNLTTTYSTKTATVNGFSFTVNKGYKGSGNVIQMNSSQGSGILYNTTPISGLKSIQVNVSSGSRTYTITTGTSSQPSTNSQTGTTTKTFNASTGDKYFQLQVSGASYFSSIVITYEEDERTPSSLAWSQSIISARIGDTFVAPTLTKTPASIADITYSSSKPSVASINASTGEITLNSIGTTTITATFAGDETYRESDASYILAVDAGTSEVVTFSEQGYENGEVVASYNGNVFDIAFDTGSGTNDPAYYNTGNAFRLYAKNSMTISSELPIYRIVIEYSQRSLSATLSNGTITNNGTTDICEVPNKKSVTYTVGGSSGHNRVSSITVYTFGYTRTTTADNYGTICLPFAVAAADRSGATFYSVAGVTKSGEKITGVALEEVAGDLVAGTPYIFKATDSKIVAGYKGEASDVKAATGLVGNLGTAATINAGEYIYILGTDNKMHKLSGTATATVATNRAYLNLEGVAEAPASVKGVRLYFDGSEEATAITEITKITEKTEGTEGVIYNLQGQRVNSLQKGINIVGGKKVLVK